MKSPSLLLLLLEKIEEDAVVEVLPPDKELNGLFPLEKFVTVFPEPKIDLVEELEKGLFLCDEPKPPLLVKGLFPEELPVPLLLNGLFPEPPPNVLPPELPPNGLGLELARKGLFPEFPPN